MYVPTHLLLLKRDIAHMGSLFCMTRKGDGKPRGKEGCGWGVRHHHIFIFSQTGECITFFCTTHIRTCSTLAYILLQSIGRLSAHSILPNPWMHWSCSKSNCSRSSGWRQHLLFLALEIILIIIVFSTNVGTCSSGGVEYKLICIIQRKFVRAFEGRPRQPFSMARSSCTAQSALPFSWFTWCCCCRLSSSVLHPHPPTKTSPLSSSITEISFLKRKSTRKWTGKN